MTDLTPLEKAQAKMTQMRADGWKPGKPRTPVQMMRDKPNSLRARINANCWQCVGESKKDVTECTVKSCPFWDVRPWQKSAADD